MLPNDDPTIQIQILAKANQAKKELDDLDVKLNKVTASANKTKQAVGGVGQVKILPDVTERQIAGVNTALDKTGVAATKAGKGLFTLNNFARTAIGTLEAMGIFLVTQFVSQMVNKAIDSLKQLELAIYRIGIAERALSQAGVDITPQQLTDIVAKVVDTYRTVSEIDATKMVSNLAVLTKDLKLTADQYEKIATAIPLIAQQSDVSIESATDQIVTGLTKSGRGWADLGITVDAAIIKQRAVAEGLVASAEAYDNLTAEQKQQVEVLALINILYDNAQDNLASQDEYLKSVAGKQAALNKEWETFTTELGVLGSPAIKSGLDLLIWWVQQMVTGIENLQFAYKAFMAGLIGLYVAFQGVLSGNITSISEFIALAKQGAAEAAKALEAYMTPQIGGDTPTGEAPQTDDVIDNQEDLQKALERMNDEILEAQLKLAQDMEDAAIDLGRKLEDITIEYARKRADAEIDYMSTVADINADYQNTIAQINQEQAQANAEAHADELQREAEFQEQMRQLKERFLMDLEDALHARDARQILRLIKQYNLEKEQAEREYALEQENAQREQEIRNQRFQAERADAERQRQAKLAEARREYQDKLAKLAADEAAERAAAELAYQRKMEDLEREMQNRLEIVAANLIAEFNLTKEGLDAILALYKKYYAEVAQIYAAMNAMLAGQANVGSTSKPAGGPTGGGTGGGGGSTSGSGGAKPFAEGGTVIANRPTRALFGEKGLEMATFTPLGRTGQDINKVFSNLSGEAGGEGRLTLEMLLSPDLEARIVQNTLGQTANVIMKVQRSK